MCQPWFYLRLVVYSFFGIFTARGLVEVLERSGPDTRGCGGSFEETFQIMVMVLIQPPDGNEFLRASQLAFYVAVLSADTGF